ncbi:oxidoreductase FAD-binding protein [Deinococcus malanensis]|uniref:Oxidoreductase FAD-binding protein n=1 Tax=Deinococcus malanensis TaxID=1706855 RepID=A0ABQ2EPW7_9DEIO|nr:NAD(P)/FAD-dependent oxidoreductase [Deinococcus malanensis]GGK16771.1 oxidoreductase FAD-binding protein [Deinococcus malanensis]
MLDVLVVGGGLSGLSAARVLRRAGQRVRVVEAGSHPGGRVATRVVDGFTLDAGYQVLFPAYPAVQRQLNLAALDLVPLPSGAAIRRGARVDVVGDPLRDPAGLPGTLTTRVIPLGDKLRLARLALQLRGPAPHALLRGPDETTEAYLRRQGFSDSALDTFFRPFFGGIFLRRDLSTSARLFRYYFRMLIDGGAALPRGGIGAIAAQLAAGLELDTGVRVRRLAAHGAHVTAETSAGDLDARQVIVATDPFVAQELTGEPTARGRVSSTYLYYATAQAIDPETRLLLNAAADGLINNAQWTSQAVPGRAPAGQHLLTVSVLGEPHQDDAALDQQVRAELAGWYGSQNVATLRLLHVERIAYAQFPQPPEFAATLPGHATRLPGVLLASEVTSMSSLQGALESGEKAAAIVLGDLAAQSRPRGA